MTRRPRPLHPLVILVVLCAPLALLAFTQTAPATGLSATITVKNTIAVARPSETIVLDAAAIKKAVTVDDLRKVHVTDPASGKELVAQAVDLNDDGTFDQVIFQADLAANAARVFGLTVGASQVHTKDQFKAFGRFVRERRDDYAWENDRTAHRMYGKALETWAQEPLTSSSVDVWFKRTRKLVINDWYMIDDYHKDHGEGADEYSAGKSRGCGGNGIWDGGKLIPSANFVESRSLANGPVRVMFELTYPVWVANGKAVSEVKRITLDAGQNINRFESRYTISPAGTPEHAAGIKKNADGKMAVETAKGLLWTWEPVKADGSNFGCAVIADPSVVKNTTEADGNYLLVTSLPASGVVTYYTGAGWDKSGDFPTIDAWKTYVEQAAQRLASPVTVAVVAK